MKKILLLVVGAIVLVVAAVLSTLAFVKATNPELSAVEPPAPVVEEPVAEEEQAVDEEEPADETANEDVVEEGQFDPNNAIYQDFHPSFVVNITDGDRNRYLALDVTAVGYSQRDIDALRTHMPAIRNDLITLFSSKDASTLRTSEGKEALRQEALEVIRRVMEQKYGAPAIQEVYFSKFVIQ